MGLFNFPKSGKNENIKTVSNSIGEFKYLIINGERQYKGKVKSTIAINYEINVTFPLIDENISTYQIDYFRRIENNWISILNQLSIKKPDTDFRDYKVLDVFIPDKGNESYDKDAEIVLEKEGYLVSLVMKDLDIDEIIEC